MILSIGVDLLFVRRVFVDDSSIFGHKLLVGRWYLPQSGNETDAYLLYLETVDQLAA